MKVHQLRLRHVKGVTEQTVDFPDRGVVVIAGPNEVGKSTLVEALDRLLDPRAKATSQASRVRELQPVGQDVGPFVEAELTLGQTRVRFAKRWLREPMTTLEVIAPVPASYTGGEAQERFDALLADSLDRPLWEALRFAQSGAAHQRGVADSRVLTEALDAATGVDLHAAEGELLLQRVEKEYLRFHTPTGRPGGELKAAQAAHLEAQDEAVRAHTLLQEATELIERHHRLRLLAVQLDAQQPAIVQRCETAQAHWEEASRAQRAHVDATTVLDQARERVAQAESELRHRTALLEALSRAQGAIAQAEQAGGAAAQLWDQAQLATVEADRVERAAEDAWRGHREVLELAQQRLQLVQDRDEDARLAEAEREWQRIEADQARLLADLGPEPLSAARLRALEDAARELAVAQGAAQAVSAQVVIDAPADAAVLVDGQAEVSSVTVEDTVVIELPAGVRVTVEPGADAREAGRRVERAQQQYARALHETGCADLGEARARREVVVGAEQQRIHLQERRATLHRAHGDAAAVAAQRAALGQQHQAPPGQEPLPDLATARAVVTAARRAEAAARAELDHASATARQAASAESRARAEVQRHHAARDAAEATFEEVQERLQAARAERPDDAVAADVTDRRAIVATAQAQVQRSSDALAATDPERAAREHRDAAQVRAEHEAHRARVREEAIAVAAQVELISGEGRQESLDQAMLTLAHARDELIAVDRRAAAARHLHEALLRHRDNAHQAYVRPFAEALRQLGAELYGDSFRVQVGPDLQIISRSLDGTVVPFEHLSGGAQEQLGILARLAVATLVDPAEGVPVILDDALGYTDPERLRRIGSVFDAPARQAQVILLTCTPERYASVTGVQTVSLSA